MSEYGPPLIAQAGSGAFQWTNCGLARLAMAILDHHAGVCPADLASGLPWPPTPAVLRKLSGDTKGGTKLSQHVILGALYQVPIEARYDVPFDDAWDEAASTGKGLLLDGAYAGFSAPHRKGSPGFLGNHGVLVVPGRFINDWDPLHDGRRAGIPKGPVSTPRAELRAFAGALRFESGRRLGDGRAYVGLYDATREAAQPRIPVDLGGDSMILASTGLTSRRRIALPKGTPVYREPGGPRVTRMAKDSAPPYIGMAGVVDGTRYQAVLVATKNFPDRQSRRVVGYIEYGVGQVQ